jgi:hypothetical protein
MCDETLYAERALRAGEREATTGLVGAIRTVLAGRIYVSEPCHTRSSNGLGQEDASPEVP